MMRWWSSFATAEKELVRNKGGNHQDNCTSFAHVVFGDLQAPSMGFLLESLSMLCSCVPLIDKQAIEDPIHILAMKPIRLTENPLLSKTESLGDCACYLSHRRSRLYATHAPRTRASPSFDKPELPGLFLAS